MNPASDPSNLPSLPCPFSRHRSHELAGNKSSIVKLSLDEPDTWPNHIFENSRYATFIWHKNEEKMSLLTYGYGMSKFRKQKCDSPHMFLDKITAYITKNQEHNS